MSKIGKNIRKIRTAKGLSQAAFAEVFGLTRASIGAYEEGRAEPKLDVIIQIANYFSFSLDQILKKELTVNEIHQFELPVEKSERESSKTKIPERSESSGLKSVLLVKHTQMELLKSQKWDSLENISLNKSIWNVDLMIQLCPDIKRNDHYWMDGSWIMLADVPSRVLMDNLDYLVLIEEEVFILKGYKIPEKYTSVWEITWLINSLSNFKHLANDSRFRAFETRLNQLEKKS